MGRAGACNVGVDEDGDNDVASGMYMYDTNAVGNGAQ